MSILSSSSLHPPRAIATHQGLDLGGGDVSVVVAEHHDAIPACNKLAFQLLCNIVDEIEPEVVRTVFSENTCKRVRKLTENNVGILDRTYIVDASVLLTPYRRTDEVTGETTQTAYLKSISVEKDVDPIREDLEDLGYDIDEDDNDIVNQINEANADLLLVCLGAPKQEKFMKAHQQELKTPLKSLFRHLLLLWYLL